MQKQTSILFKTLNGKPPLIIGHRGASGFLPDHTLEAYALAIDQGADYIEMDLVMTKDGALICRHEPMLAGTTNVADLPEFESRKTVKLVDGILYNDWFSCDFTLAELKKLRAKQPFPDRPQQYTNQFAIPTLEEAISLAKYKSSEKNRVIGIYPETKHPTFHEKSGLFISDKLLDKLETAGWNNAAAPVFVQSFEVGNLQYIRSKSAVKLVQLLDGSDVTETGEVQSQPPFAQPYDFTVSADSRTYKELTTNEGLAFVSSYANGIGVWKPYIQPYNGKTLTKLPATDLIERAHKIGLAVHAFTFRNENRFLLKDYENRPTSEYEAFIEMGLDGFFTDFPVTAKTTLESLRLRQV